MLRILTCNIRGLRSHAKCVNVFNQFACDVLCLQETWWDAGVVQSVEALWPGLVFHSSGLDRSRGVAVLFRPGVVSDVVCVWRDEAGRVLILDFQLEGRQYRLGCVYAPTDIAERVVFFEGLSQWCNADCLWVGDFNTKLSALDQGRGGPLHPDRGRQALYQLMREADLVDAWRVANLGARVYSWYRVYRSVLQLSRIDLCLAAGGVIDCVTGSEYGDNSFSDHRHLTFTLGRWGGVLIQVC